MIKTCEREACGKQYTTKETGQRYCCKQCAQGYSDEEKAYIIANYGVIPTKQIAEKVGVKPGNIRRNIGFWREKGVAIPNGFKRAAIGDKSIRIERGKEVEYVKTATGWERVNKGNPLGRPKGNTSQNHVDLHSRKEKKDKPKTIDMGHNYNNQKQFKKRREEDARMKTRVIDLSACVAVRIPEMNMTVYTKKGQTPEQVREYWLQHRDNELRGHSFLMR